MSTSSKRACALLLAALTIVFSNLSPALAATYTGTVNADQVFLRTRPNTSCDYYDKLDKGDKVTLLDINGDFYKVTYKTFTGYMMRSFVNASGAAKRALGASQAPERESKYAKVGSISGLGDAPRETRKGSYGDDVEKLQRALQIKGYLKGYVDGRYGDQTASAVSSYQKAVKLSATGRADNKTIQKLFGKPGETTPANDPGMDGIRSISQIDVPSTCRPGNRSRNVKALQQALKLNGYYKAAVDSGYGDKTRDAVKRYQKAVGLSADGIAGFSTIRKLFGKNAANYTIPTEKLDWFHGGRSVIPKGATFTVKDVSTGKTFTARRWSGINHLDAEPVDSDAARTLKDISGGSFSWARRAVLVKYNGHVYAASINTLPHGTSTISGNGYTGHFCLHFYKSKTHDTNRVDAAHQNAVARAMNASW